MTEYDIPVDTRIRGVTGAKGAECGFDPDQVLEAEFAKDDLKQQEMEAKLYGGAQKQSNPFQLQDDQLTDHNIFKLAESVITNEEKGILGV